ncbi:MAG: helix-turn-helix transcriptional regulator [Microthrixaceae bacterium]
MDSWPLAGREALLGEAERALAAGSSVLVTGPAGIGKSRWCRELLNRLEPPYRVERVQAGRATSGIPLGALWSLDLEGGESPSVGAMAAAATALLAMADTGRLVIGVDDVDHLDPVSAVVLADVLRSDRAVAVFSCRERALGGSGDPLTVCLDAGPIETFELGPLEESSVAELLEAVLDGPVDGAAVRRLHELSGGNPLLLREVVHSARAGGELEQRRDWWYLASSPRPTAALVDLVRARMDHLDPPAAEALECLALTGPVELAVLEAMGSGSAVEQLEESGLVDVRGVPPVVGLAHPLYGDVAVDRLTVSRRRRHVRRLADVLAEAPSGRYSLAVASWMLEGHLDPDPDLLLRSCRRLRGIDDAQAARFARASIEAGGGARAALALGEALVDLGDGESAVAELASVDPELLPEADRVRIVLGHVATLAWLRHDLDGALRVLEELGADLALPSARAELHAVASGVNVFAGRLDRAMEEVRRARSCGTLQDSARSMVVLTELAVAGLEGRRDLLEPLIAEVDSMIAGLFLAEPKSALRLGMALMMARILALAPGPLEDHGGEVYELGVALDVPLVRCAGAIGLGVAAMLAGRTATAERRLREAVAVGEQPHFGFVPYASDLAVICSSRRESGPHPAEDPMDASWDGQRMPFFEPERLRAGARREYARGRTSAAVDRARAAAGLAARRGQLVFEVLALHDLAEYGCAADVADRLAELAPTSALAAAAAARAAALGRADPEGVLSAAAAFSECGFPLDAVVAAREAERLARADGRPGLALSAAAAAGEYGASCEALPTATSDPVGELLTPREREVATLAAEGRRDAEIAEELFLSVRTVQTHLARVYGKLGISGRKELAGLLRSPAGPPAGIA